MRAVPRVATMRQATIKTQTVRAVNHKVTLVQTARALPVVNKVSVSKFSTKVQTEEEFDRKYVDYFNRADIDGWEIRKGMADLVAMDLVPEPEIVAAALRACRRVNDFSLTTRILEVVKIKCGDREAEIWPYMLQQLRPTLAELGIPDLAEMNYDKPELALPNPYEIH